MKIILTINNENTSFQNIICGVPHRYNLGPLVLKLYIDLKNVSNALDQLIFVKDTNLKTITLFLPSSQSKFTAVKNE